MPRLLTPGQRAARTRKQRTRAQIKSVANAIKLINGALKILKEKQRQVIDKRKATRRRNVASFVVTAAALALLTTVAHAENWQTVDTARDGAIMEIDMDTIQHNKDGSAAVEATGGRMYLDCKGHFGGSPLRLQHIPHLSIAEQAEEIVCKR